MTNAASPRSQQYALAKVPEAEAKLYAQRSHMALIGRWHHLVHKSMEHSPPAVLVPLVA